MTKLNNLQINRPELLSTFETLPKGSMFKGVIRFENLRMEELGLLLLSLRYRNEGEQETFLLGGAKPYGYGKITLHNVQLRLIEQATRYTSFNIKEIPATDKIEGFKRSFRLALKEKYGIAMETTDTLRIYLAYSGNEHAENGYIGQNNEGRNAPTSTENTHWRKRMNR